MRKYMISLLSMLILSSMLVAGYGAYIKYDILEPMGIYQDKSVMQLPFLMISDKGLSYMIRMEQEKKAQTPTEPPAEESTAASTEAPTSAPTEAATVPTVPATVPTEAPAPTEAPTEIPAEAPTEAPAAAIMVDEKWFDDALFIGNSLTVGLRDFAPLGEADYFCSVGLTVFDVFKERLQVENMKYRLLEDLLKENEYGKIFIHLGTNECGYPAETFINAYGEMLDKIRSYQPDAEIIIHGIITFGRVKAVHTPYMTPELIALLNEELRALAEDRQLHYIDFNPYIVDEEGYLPDDWSSDGCHPRIAGYQQWSRWILENAGSLTIGLDGILDKILG